MESACLRHTEIPHTSSLFADFQYNFDKVARFYDYNPHDGRSFAAAAAQLDYPDDRRAALVEALRASNRETASLDLLARPGTMAVVTGQQVGLFSGPAYTIYKALSAIRLAARLNEEGIPAVPIFWLATEDHDLPEVDHTFVFGTDHQPIRLSAKAEGGLNRPVGRMRLSAPPVDQLAAALNGFASGEEVVELIRAAYPPGATLGQGFRALLERLLSGRGLLFIDPLDESIRRIAAPLLENVVRQDDALHAKLIERGKQLEEAGYHAQVHVEPKTSLLFLLDSETRAALRRHNGEYVSKDKSAGRKYSPQELIERAEELSPNALLRPVMQDYVLPTVCYVGGPAELAYMAQSQVLYRELLGRMPVMTSRCGFTLLDTRGAKLMQRYGLAVPAFFHGEEAVREKMGSKLVPSAVAREFGEARRAMSESVEALRDRLTKFDPTLASAAEKSGAKMLYQLAKIESKTARETLKREERASRDASYISGLIFPDKHLQERYYSILPFLAKHGVADLIDAVYGHLNIHCPDHQVLVV